jgi:hypothetical protein
MLPAFLWLVTLCAALAACAPSPTPAVPPSPAALAPSSPASSAASATPLPSHPVASGTAPAVAASGAARPAGGVAPPDPAREDTAHRARQLRASIVLWMASNPGECPSLETVVNARLATPTPPITDAWGQRFRVLCTEDSALVESVGPDGAPGTADDLREPR